MRGAAGSGRGTRCGGAGLGGRAAGADGAARRRVGSLGRGNQTLGGGGDQLYFYCPNCWKVFKLKQKQLSRWHRPAKLFVTGNDSMMKDAASRGRLSGAGWPGRRRGAPEGRDCGPAPPGGVWEGDPNLEPASAGRRGEGAGGGLGAAVPGARAALRPPPARTELGTRRRGPAPRRPAGGCAPSPSLSLPPPSGSRSLRGVDVLSPGFPGREPCRQRGGSGDGGPVCPVLPPPPRPRPRRPSPLCTAPDPAARPPRVFSPSACRTSGGAVDRRCVLSPRRSRLQGRRSGGRPH